MKPERIREILSQGEGISVEFKECTNELSKSVWETVCSFSNRYGGHLILGANDKGEIIGVNPNSIEQIKKNFSNTANNPQKMSPSLFLNLDDFEIDGKRILYVYVPMSSQIQNCNGKIYDRNEDGDYDITNASERVGQIVLRKSSIYTEREVFPYLKDEDLRMDVVDKAIKMATVRKDEHPWKKLSYKEFFLANGLYE